VSEALLRKGLKKTSKKNPYYLREQGKETTNNKKKLLDLLRERKDR